MPVVSVSVDPEASAVTAKGAIPERGLKVRVTAGGASGAGLAVGTGFWMGAGRAEGTTTAVTRPGWEAAGGRLGSGVAEGDGDGDGEGCATSTGPVAGRVDG